MIAKLVDIEGGNERIIDLHGEYISDPPDYVFYQSNLYVLQILKQPMPVYRWASYHEAYG